MLFAAISFGVAFGILCIDICIDFTADPLVTTVYYTTILRPIAVVGGSIGVVCFTTLLYTTLYAQPETPPETVQLSQTLIKLQCAMLLLYFSIIVPEYVRVLNGFPNACYMRIGAAHVSLLILCVAAIFHILAAGPLALVVY